MMVASESSPQLRLEVFTHHMEVDPPLPKDGNFYLHPRTSSIKSVADIWNIDDTRLLVRMAEPSSLLVD
jgi:hypothetical protein